jgi:hypothetical protein
VGQGSASQPATGRPGKITDLHLHRPGLCGPARPGLLSGHEGVFFGFYAWQADPVSEKDLEDAYLTDTIFSIWEMSRGPYGSKGPCGVAPEPRHSLL